MHNFAIIALTGRAFLTSKCKAKLLFGAHVDCLSHTFQQITTLSSSLPRACFWSHEGEIAACSGKKGMASWSSYSSGHLSPRFVHLDKSRRPVAEADKSLSPIGYHFAPSLLLLFIDIQLLTVYMRPPYTILASFQSQRMTLTEPVILFAEQQVSHEDSKTLRCRSHLTSKQNQTHQTPADWR
jgi:hypothetical protein